MPDTSRQPYPGLRPFEADEADVFFGREDHVDALLERLSRSHFVAVVGESGAGKSSLVRAGLLPSLDAGFVVEVGSDWRVAVMRPGGSPLGALADALLAPGVLSDAGGSPHRDFALAELRRGPLGLVQLVRDAHLGDHCNVLLVVDQFEELFRYCREPAQKDQANVFVELILHASIKRQVPIFVVLTMRSDFVGDCARFRGLPEMLNDNQYLTPRLSREQIAAAIREPARVCGGTVETALVDELCNAVGDDQDQLPLLQHLLMRLWDHARRESDTPRLTPELSRTMGGLRLALNNHAQQIYDALGAGRQPLARTLFKSLTDPRSARRDLRRDALVSEIAAIADAPADSVIAVADEFRGVGRHMLMPPPSVPLTAESRLDISHESLLRQWSAVSDWARQEAANAREFDGLRGEAQMERDGRGELLSGKDLARATEWATLVQPTPMWAARYATAGELEATLNFISRSEAEAKRRHDVELGAARRERSARRTKILAWAAVVGFTGVAIGLWQAIGLRRQAEAGRQEALAGRAQAHASRLATNALLEVGNDPTLSVLLARAALTIRPSDEQAAGALRAALAAHVPSATPEFSVAKSKTYVDANKSKFVQFSLSAASVSNTADIAIVPTGRGAQIFSTATGEPIRRVGEHSGIVGAARISPDGRLAVTSSADGTARVWRTADGQPVATLDQGDVVNNAVFGPDGSFIVTLADNGGSIWRVGPYTKHCSFFQSEELIGVTFSRDQRLMAAVAYRGGWEIVDITLAGCPRIDPPELAAHRASEWAMFSSDGTALSLVSAEALTVLNVPDWTVKRQAPLPPVVDSDTAQVDAIPRSMAWSSDGRYVALAGQGSGYSVLVADLDLETSEPPRNLRGHAGEVRSVSFHPTEHRLLTTGVDRTARLWNLDDEELAPVVMKGHRDTVGSGVFARGGRQIVTAGDDGAVRIWTPLVDTETSVAAGIGSAATSSDREVESTCENIRPDGDKPRIRYCADRDTLMVASKQAGTLNIPVTPQTRVEQVRFSADGLLLAVALENHTTRVHETETGALRSEMRGYDGDVVEQSFSRDDRYLASATDDGRISVWDVGGGAKIGELAFGDAWALDEIAFSDDARTVLLTNGDMRTAWHCRSCGNISQLLDEVRERKIGHRVLSPAEVERFGITTDELNADPMRSSGQLPVARARP
jgi:WD40 repeat protein